MKDSPILTLHEVRILIEHAKNSEICRDTKSLRETLSQIWTDINEKPDFSEYDALTRADLLRICGVFLNFYGYQNSLKNYQERGKDLLTEASEIFRDQGLPDKSIEAQVMLAFCYWNAGEISEAEIILDVAEELFGEDSRHPVYLQIKLNRMLILFAKKRTEEALQMIKDLKPLMMFCKDFRLQTMFHNQAGIFYTNTKDFGKAFLHLHEAISYAENGGNKLFVAINYNNLSYLYKEKGVFAKAFECIDRSINGFRAIRNYGYLAHALDTQAQIHFAAGDSAAALSTINEAIKVFEQGDDHRGLCEALFSKVKFLFSENQTNQALLAQSKMLQIAEERMGESAAESYAERISQEVYPIRNLPLAEEVAEFKKSLISSALVKADGAIIKAAQILKLKSHQSLSWILKFKYPTLMSELGFTRHAQRRTRKSSKKIYLNSKDARSEKEIKLLDMPGKSLSFDFYLNTEKYEVFYLDKYFMKPFGINEDAVVSVIPVKQYRTGMPVIVLYNDAFTVGQTEYEKNTDFYFVVEPETGFWIPLGKDNVLGEPIGYCPFKDTNGEIIKFSRLALS